MNARCVLCALVSCVVLYAHDTVGEERTVDVFIVVASEIGESVEYHKPKDITRVPINEKGEVKAPPVIVPLRYRKETCLVELSSWKAIKWKCEGDTVYRSARKSLKVMKSRVIVLRPEGETNLAREQLAWDQVILLAERYNLLEQEQGEMRRALTGN